jgi:hypothetical protein
MLNLRHLRHLLNLLRFDRLLMHRHRHHRRFVLHHHQHHHYCPDLVLCLVCYLNRQRLAAMNHDRHHLNRR